MPSLFFSPPPPLFAVCLSLFCLVTDHIGIARALCRFAVRIPASVFRHHINASLVDSALLYTSLCRGYQGAYILAATEAWYLQALHPWR